MACQLPAYVVADTVSATDGARIEEDCHSVRAQDGPMWHPELQQHFKMYKEPRDRQAATFDIYDEDLIFSCFSRCSSLTSPASSSTGPSTVNPGAT